MTVVQPLIILHTNDIHARIEGLARVATLVAETRGAHPSTPVLYVDAGDLEEGSVRVSNLTKGTAMHQVARVAGCQVAVVGNAAALRYGVEVLAAHAAAAQYPLLLANLRTPAGALLPGVQASTCVDLAGLRLGIIGVTAEFPEYVRVYGLQMPPALVVIQEEAARLRAAGADAVILLSHLGLPADRVLAAALQDTVPLIIGGHTHDLLPVGEWVGRVCLVQAGAYAESLGRVDLTWDGTQLAVQQAQVLAVAPAILPAPAVLAVATAAEAQVAQMLDTIIADLPAALDFALDQECGVGCLVAEVLRARMAAEIGVAVVGAAFTGPLPAGPLRRVTLYDVCDTSSGPAVVDLTGAQLTALVARGRTPEFAQARPRPLRGQPAGLVHLSGATWVAGQVQIGGQPLDAARIYRVAGTDWEFEPYGGCADPAWGLQPTYELPLILREVIEAYLADPPHRGLPLVPEVEPGHGWG